MSEVNRDEWLNVTLKEGAQILGENITRAIHNELFRLFKEWPVHRRPDRVIVEIEDAGCIVFDGYGVGNDDDVQTVATVRYSRSITIV